MDGSAKNYILFTFSLIDLWQLVKLWWNPERIGAGSGGGISGSRVVKSREKAVYCLRSSGKLPPPPSATEMILIQAPTCKPANLQSVTSILIILVLAGALYPPLIHPNPQNPLYSTAVQHSCEGRFLLKRHLIFDHHTRHQKKIIIILEVWRSSGPTSGLLDTSGLHSMYLFYPF